MHVIAKERSDCGNPVSKYINILVPGSPHSRWSLAMTVIVITRMRSIRGNPVNKQVNILISGSPRRLQRLVMTESGYCMARDDKNLSLRGGIRDSDVAVQELSLITIEQFIWHCS